MDKSVFRWELKRRTDFLHRQLDERVAVLGIDTLDGYTAFVRMTEGALGTLATANPDAEPQFRHAIEELRDSARTDLNLLGYSTKRSGFGVTAERPKIGLGAMYVVCGSRLGGRVLQKQITNSTNPRIRAATRYFRPHHADTLWREVVERLNTALPDERQEIVDDAVKTFTLYQEFLGQPEEMDYPEESILCG